MNRRLVLASAAIVFSSTVAGCSSDDPPPSQCHLMHEVVKSADDYGEVHDTYRYDDLSPDAQVVVEETVENGHFETPDQSLNSDEFRYRDETTVYMVKYQNETYTLLTYTGEGCEIE